MKILLIGAISQLGSDLIKNNPGHHIVESPWSVLDLARNETIDTAARETGPDWVINAAAFHNVPLSPRCYRHCSRAEKRY